MAKVKKKVVEKSPVFGESTTKGGAKMKAGVRLTFEDGTKRVLLTPAGKAAKAAKELRDGVHMTNGGQVKSDKNGVVKPLTDSQRAWRSGYLAARKDSAKAYKASKKK